MVVEKSDPAPRHPGPGSGGPTDWKNPVRPANRIPVSPVKARSVRSASPVKSRSIRLAGMVPVTRSASPVSPVTVTSLLRRPSVLSLPLSSSSPLFLFRLLPVFVTLPPLLLLLLLLLLFFLYLVATCYYSYSNEVWVASGSDFCNPARSRPRDLFQS